MTTFPSLSLTSIQNTISLKSSIVEEEVGEKTKEENKGGKKR